MNNTEAIAKSLIKRNRREKRFKYYGIISIAVSTLTLLVLFVSITANGFSSFFQQKIKLDIYFGKEDLRLADDWTKQDLESLNLKSVINTTLYRHFPEYNSGRQKRFLRKLTSTYADLEIQKKLINNPQWVDTTQTLWVSASHRLDRAQKQHAKGHGKPFEKAVVKKLVNDNRIDSFFNTNFFKFGDSRSPEQAGILGALVGTFLTLLVTFFISFPIGISSAIYLEEFAPKNRFTDFIEVNINNLAAVPSIIFGLLGLSIFLQYFGMPRSSPLVGGVVLSLMTLPVIIIASRAAINSVPSSIKEAALGVGASKMQAVFHHQLPLAIPGILTGSIIGLARALGETAPLLMIGMVAFIVDIPNSFTSPATVLPIQIYLWANNPEAVFIEKTSAGIFILLCFLVLMNLGAIILRNKLSRKW